MPFKILIMKIVTFLMSPSALTRVLRVVPIRVDFSLLLSGFFLIIKQYFPYHQVDFSLSSSGFFLIIKQIFPYHEVDFSLSSSGFFLVKIWISLQCSVDFLHHQVDENCDLLNVTRCFGQSVWVGSCESVTFTEFDQFLNDSECIPIMKMTMMRKRMCLCLGVVLIVASGFEKNAFFNLYFSFLCCVTAIGGHLDLVESIENDSEKVRKALQMREKVPFSLLPAGEIC